jgi:hypothetical protein
MSINSAENIYGQHIMCLSLTLSMIDSIALKLMIIKPNKYHSTITSTASTTNLYNLAIGKYNTDTSGFQRLSFIIQGSTSIRSIYKNPDVNNTIF